LTTKQEKIKKMNDKISEIIEQSNMFFDNSENIFTSLENNTKKYSNGFWGTSILIEQTPFDFERSQLKRGKRMIKSPKNKADKFFHLQNEEENVVAVFGYIENYEYPNTYMFIQKDKDTEKIYRFDILKKMASFQQSFFENNKISKSISIQKNGDYILEFYYYDNLNRLVEIERKHKNKRTFHDTSFFPDNVYSTTFILEYVGNDIQPNKIFWNAPHREPKQVWARQ